MVEIDYRLLGPFEVHVDRRPVAVPGDQRRALLAVLLLAAPRVVPLAHVVESLWSGDPPRSSVNLVHGYVSDWRQALEPDRPRRTAGRHLLSAPGGYRMEVGAGALDVARFEEATVTGRRALDEGDLVRAGDLLAAALREWRGPALQDLVDLPFAAPSAAGLQARRLDVVEQLAALHLRCGRADLVLPLVTEHAPTQLGRERLTELQMIALYRLGRQAEALAVYDEQRRSLWSELGVDPGGPLRELHLRMLRHDRTLERQHDREVGVAAPVLPVALSSFVGRQAEVDAVAEARRAGHRLLTLVGPAGSGKTRLAVEVAARCAQEPASGTVAFVDLAKPQAAAGALMAVAEALGLPEVTDRTSAHVLADRLGSRRALVVADDADLVLAVAPRLAELVSLAPGLTVLATARQPLGVAGERVLDVQPLPLPRPGEREVARLRASDAVQLLVQRVQASSGRAVEDADLPVVGGICRRLDGLPLALELAAAWTRTLGLSALLEQLDHSTELLTDSSADRPVHHRTLRAAVDRSWRSLTPAQSGLLEAMSVFASGAALEAVQALGETDDAVVLLRALVDRSLLRREGDPEHPRYALLTTLREYAGERLAARPGAERAARDRHAIFVAEVMRRASMTPPAEGALRLLDDVDAEVRTALDHLTSAGQHTQRLSLAVDAFTSWWDSGRLGEGLEQLQGALSAAGPAADVRLQAAAQVACAALAEALGQTGPAVEAAAAGAQLARAAGDDALVAAATGTSGDLLMWLRPDEGQRLLEEAMSLARATPPSQEHWHWASPASVIAVSAYSLAESLRFRDPERARRLLVEHLDDIPWPDVRGTAAFLQRSLGFLSVDRGEWAAAERWFGLSLEGARRSGSTRSEARSHQGLADLAWARGELALAVRHASVALQLSREAGHTFNLARAAARLVEAQLEAKRVPAAQAVLADTWPRVAGHDRAAADKLLAAARARAARLTGDTDTARHLLSCATRAQPGDELRPERVTNLLERAALSLDTEPDTARDALDQLEAQARTTGLVLPMPDQARCAALRAGLASLPPAT